MLEEIDARIVAVLAADGRCSYTDLAERVGLSVSAVHQRVRRLEKRGVIRGYTAHLDSEMIGLPLTAFVSLTPIDPAAPDDYPQMLAGLPQIEACHSVAGVESYIIKVRVASPSALEALLGQIRVTAGVSTRTTVVLSTPFEARAVAPDVRSSDTAGADAGALELSATARYGAELRYPNAERDDVVDDLHGVRVADPYRYLEDPDNPRTLAFVTAQNAVSRPYLAALPGARWFHDTVTALLSAPRRGVPWERGGRYFVLANPGELDQDRLLTGDSLRELLDEPRVLLDPNLLSADGTVAMTAARVSPHGSLLAYALADGGSDWRTIRVRDVATGLDLPDALPWTKWVEPTWLPDESGFLYWRYPPPPDGGSAALTEATGAGELRLHRIGSDPAGDQLVWSAPDRPDWLVEPWLADDGRWLVLVASPGTDSRSTVHARRLVAGPAGLRPAAETVALVDDLADAHRVIGCSGDTVFMRTERDAPRGRLVAVDVTDPAAPWQQVVAQHESAVLVDASPAAGAFVLVRSHDAAHSLDLVDREGRPLPGPALGDPISVTAVHTRPAGGEVFVGVSSFTRPPASLRFVIDGDPPGLRDLSAPMGAIDLRPTRGVRQEAISRDGTAVRLTVLTRTDTPPGPRPALLYGYGGFDIPVLASFSALFAGWVQAGGVLAVANLRGGGEFGADWHRAGMGRHKQRVFDDFICSAEHLIRDGITTADALAIHGRSNGGLLVGAAMTQRPDLFAAALPTVGVLDMLRFARFTIGWAWISEYGDPADPDDFATLLDYSPLHRLVAGTAYPAALLCTGDHDDRVVPGHSLKFAAELQRCQAGSAPVLVRVDVRAGHGMGKPITALAAEYADQLAFAAAHTGLVTTGDPHGMPAGGG